MVEHLVRMHTVLGSIPRATKKKEEEEEEGGGRRRRKKKKKKEKELRVVRA
jgi:hypothetical protein